MTKPTVSVALATFNEQENLERCLNSVREIADEIIIVDGQSVDDTVKIAKKFKAKVTLTTNKPIFHINKQMAVELCKSDWVLSLDADEVVSNKLAKEIKNIVTLSEAEIRSRRKKNTLANWPLFDRHQELLAQRDGEFKQESSETVAFFIPRLNMFLGHSMRHTGVYPDAVIRLFKKGKAAYPAKSVHEQIKVYGRVDWLVNDLIHYDSPTFAKYLKRANRYTELTAKEFQKNNINFNTVNWFKYIIFKPVFTFLNLFFRHKGFLDGIPGFIFSLMSGLHWPIAYLKYYELQLSTS